MLGLPLVLVYALDSELEIGAFDLADLYLWAVQLNQDLTVTSTKAQAVAT